MLLHSFLQGTCYCSSMVSIGCSVHICSMLLCLMELPSPQAAGTSCPTLFFPMGCMGTPALTPGAPPPPWASQTLLFLSHPFFSLLSLTAAAQSFYLFFLYIFMEVPPAWLRGSAVSCSETTGASRKWLEPAEYDTGRPCPFPQRPPLQPALTKIFQFKPNTSLF